ncbi:hypothetical protein EST38_g7356 [Candolleomyces aberdarensis]|uniref:Uncharacterized protein n=1 Tax=Candolleomyces aberdarensis TaxID=2316362 RepID=A0A4V1Q3G4_9AGAR|nr:hypothetical protein EST38_g7356 [Candolleomyces aberdarensis]
MPSAVPTSLLWPSSAPSSVPSSSFPSSVPADNPSSSSPSSRVRPQSTTAQWKTRPGMEPPFTLASGSLLSPLNLGLECPAGITLQGTFQFDSNSVSPTTLGTPLGSVSGPPLGPPPAAPPRRDWEDDDDDLAGASPFFLPPGLELGAGKEYYAYAGDGDALSSPDFMPPGLELGVQREYGIVFPGGMMEMKERPVRPHVRIPAPAVERADDAGRGQPVMTIKRPRMEDLVVGRDTRKAKRTGGHAGGKPYDQDGAKRRSRGRRSESGSESWESSGDDSDTSSTSTSTSASSSSTSSFSSTSTRGSRRSRSGVHISDAELLKKLRKAESKVDSSIDSLMDVKRYFGDSGVIPHNVGDRNEFERGVRKMGKTLEMLQQGYELMLDLSRVSST